MRSINVVIVFVVAAGGCGDSGKSDALLVSDGNALGVIALEVDRYVDNGDVFELRGLGAGGTEIATVRLRIGEISDLTDQLSGGGTFGSELTLAVGDATVRSVSRELERHQLAPQPPVIQAFLDINPVSLTLDREANIVTSGGSPNADIAYSVATSCPANQMLSSPTAGECCTAPLNGATEHINYGNNTYVYRQGPATPCTASNGGSCSGASCYYGPVGYAKPSAYSGSGTLSITKGVWGSYTYCYPAFYTSNPPGSPFGDVVGTNPTGQGCPGSDGGGGDGLWDY